MTTLLALLTSAVVAIVDQLIKLWALNSLSTVSTVPLIEGVLHLTYAENTGASFSILQGQRWFLITVTSLIVIAGFYLILSKRLTKPVYIWCSAFILGGGIGNLIDRIFRGFVVDYVDFRLINFAVFNLADSCVVCGVIVLIGYMLLFDRESLIDKEKTA